MQCNVVIVGNTFYVNRETTTISRTNYKLACLDITEAQLRPLLEISLTSRYSNVE